VNTKYNQFHHFQYTKDPIYPITSSYKLKSRKTTLEIYNNIKPDPVNKNPLNNNKTVTTLTACKLGYSFSTLRHGVFGQFSGKNKPNRSLNLPRSYRRLLVIPRKPRRFSSKLLKDVVDETVHYTHGLA
ncbi:hypothetical protein KIW84_015183, partial [Lathyrus oleraceus]